MSTSPLHNLRYLQQEASSLTWATIDLEQIARNYREIRMWVPESAEVMPVIKANGYGHGAVPIARRLEPEGARWFGVATLEEGIALRQAGIRERILVLSRLVPWNAALAVKWNLTPILFTVDLALAFQQAAADAHQVIAVHLMVETGMGRLGFRGDELGAIGERIQALPNLCVEGVGTNLATADDLAHPFFDVQLRRFDSIRRSLRHRFRSLTVAHCANSAAIMRAPKTASFDLVRPGLLLYGVPPMDMDGPQPRVKPALMLQTQVIQLQEHPAGTGISYSHTHIADRPVRIATIPIGYRDGLVRSLSNRSEVLIRGQRAPIVGNICMDLAMLDVTDVPEVELYDEVLIIGRREGEEVHVSEHAEAAGTIPYEIFCGLGSRVERRYRYTSKGLADAAENGQGLSNESSKS